MKRAMALVRIGVLALAAGMAGTTLQAGAPLVCFPMEIGTAASLPFGSQGWHNPSPDYDRARLVPDTLALLSPRTPVLVRMETLRRATVYVSGDPRQATALLEAVRTRSEQASAADAVQASFDFGYLVETYKQARTVLKGEGPGQGTDGRGLVLKALENTHDPVMAYALALISTDGSRERPLPYLKAALEGAPEGSPLARTIEAHARLWGSAFAELKTPSRPGRPAGEGR
jgi:hypothetical protein